MESISEPKAPWSWRNFCSRSSGVRSCSSAVEPGEVPMESGAALVQPGEAPVNQASNVSEAPGPLSGSSASCFRGLRSLFWLQRPLLVCTLWLPGDFRRLVRETFKLTFCMDDPFTQSQDVLDSIIKTRIYAQTGSFSNHPHWKGFRSTLFNVIKEIEFCFERHHTQIM